MKRIIINFYLAVLLGLIGQTIFVVVFGNGITIDRLKSEQIQAENQELEERISVLHDKIALSQVLHGLDESLESEYTTISQPLEIALESPPLPAGSLASLP